MSGFVAGYPAGQPAAGGRRRRVLRPWLGGVAAFVIGLTFTPYPDGAGGRVLDALLAGLGSTAAGIAGEANAVMSVLVQIFT